VKDGPFAKLKCPGERSSREDSLDSRHDSRKPRRLISFIEPRRLPRDPIPAGASGEKGERESALFFSSRTTGEALATCVAKLSRKVSRASRVVCLFIALRHVRDSSPRMEPSEANRHEPNRSRLFARVRACSCAFAERAPIKTRGSRTCGFCFENYVPLPPAAGKRLLGCASVG